ncbi:FAD/FMN-containing dehydrogenase [Cohaesibacter sp. ES.047]|uniref:FAD-binding oxidoreductase n=1 Tax=Cohaesibacter sp. ES.047 TaxID=1798205 RepID=UPI000BC036BC|nr:FAD-binding oxidoreductase [Cohaesibacter sp. ES.047]SNY92631.1 FAD/FMN-containing dehydrogenase [Cohaesibacter sp. ES.047]
MAMKETNSWGRIDTRAREIIAFDASVQRDGLLSQSQSYLPYGNGRSYGDSCLNDVGTLLDGRHHNRVLSLDLNAGILRAESGILLIELLDALKDSGWFIPVVPGTKFVTLGGMVANDIHGKNHGHRGTIGCHVRQFSLLRSDRERLVCAADQNSDLYAATIGGMGLTGFIEWIELSLIPVASHKVLETKLPFDSLEEGLDLLAQEDPEHEYSVAWIDSLATGDRLGRGILMLGDHIESPTPPKYGKPLLSVPFTPPIPLVAGPALSAFNKLYYWRNASQQAPHVARPDSFFFPLDAVGGWNRLYGPGGLHQHQCSLPLEGGEAALRRMLEASHDANHGSFLTVLKRFGSVRSPGLLSFPMEGFTLTLDFPNREPATHALLDRLDRITLEVGGRVNPYKDSRMQPETFRSGFSQWRALERLRDPAMMSDFWRRVSHQTEEFRSEIKAEKAS